VALQITTTLHLERCGTATRVANKFFFGFFGFFYLVESSTASSTCERQKKKREREKERKLLNLFGLALPNSSTVGSPPILVLLVGSQQHKFPLANSFQ
jgi:hypothetical protein